MMLYNSNNKHKTNNKQTDHFEFSKWSLNLYNTLVAHHISHQISNQFAECFSFKHKNSNNSDIPPLTRRLSLSLSFSIFRSIKKFDEVNKATIRNGKFYLALILQNHPLHSFFVQFIEINNNSIN